MAGSPRITIIGAGGYVFPMRISLDVLSFPELREARITLMDIHKGRLARTERLLREAIRHHGLGATVRATTDQRRAVDGADFVVVTFAVGGVAAYRHDVEIPRQFGVDQPVGDTLGPGGVFRALRSIPVYMRIAADMQAGCPDALMINYANPMSMNCWAVNTTGVRCVGLCHSVQGTSRMLAEQLKAPYEEVSFKCYGINHQAWFTEFRCRGEDVYPRLRRIMLRKFPSPKSADRGGGGRGRRDDGADYRERVRTEIMRTFGYFQTESSHHASEYTPWFRKGPQSVAAYIKKRWDYYQITRAHQGAASFAWLREQALKPLAASQEYGAYIVASMTTGKPRVIYGNVPNSGQAQPGDVARGHVIPNLPRRCCVELACLVDRNGVQPTSPGALPPQLAAINRASISVQELAVDAALTGDPDTVTQAVSMDPLTGALLTLPEIRRLVKQMLRAERRWLPQFTASFHSSRGAHK